MKYFTLSMLVIAVLIGSGQPAFSIDQPFMESALAYLQDAAKPTSFGAAKRIDRPQLLKSARESLAKAPAIYQGRKAAAEKFIDTASDQLKASRDSEALLSIQKAIAKVVEGIQLVSQSSGSASKSAEGYSTPPPKGLFGTSPDKP